MTAPYSGYAFSEDEIRVRFCIFSSLFPLAHIAHQLEIQFENHNCDRWWQILANLPSIEYNVQWKDNSPFLSILKAQRSLSYMARPCFRYQNASTIAIMMGFTSQYSHKIIHLWNILYLLILVSLDRRTIHEILLLIRHQFLATPLSSHSNMYNSENVYQNCCNQFFVCILDVLMRAYVTKMHLARFLLSSETN